MVDCQFWVQSYLPLPWTSTLKLSAVFRSWISQHTSDHEHFSADAEFQHCLKKNTVLPREAGAGRDTGKFEVPFGGGAAEKANVESQKFVKPSE